MSRLIRPVAVLAALVAATALSGCGTPPWQEAGAATPANATATATATPAAGTPGPSAPAVTDDLADGSLSRTLTAGAITATVTYWTTVPTGQWTPDAAKPLHLSLTATTPDGTSDDIYVAGAQIVATPRGGDTAYEPITLAEDTATLEPGYAATSPHSYSQAVELGSVDPKADRVEFTISYQLLLRTSPGSDTYEKQAATDTITAPISR